MKNNICPLGEDLQRYWDRRYDIFSQFDEGIEIDREGLFSTKFEDSALQIAGNLEGAIVIDAFCGVGGSAIGFARSGKQVIAIDTSRDRIRMAKHNAKIYGVDHRIEFICGDCLQLIPKTNCDSIYLDPPWGGPEYRNRERFPLEGFRPNGNFLLDVCLKKQKNLAITVPMNFAIDEIMRFHKDFEVIFHWHKDTPVYSTIFFRSVDHFSS